MAGFAPREVVEAPPRLPLPYGLFSVVSLAETATERWENGVVWEGLTCGPLNVLIGDCISPEGFPKQFPQGPGEFTADPFTVYGTYNCSGPQDLAAAQVKARSTLLAGEQMAAEKSLWLTLDNSPTVLTGGDALNTLGRLERFISDNYGALGVMHMSRRAATVLAVKGLIEAKGSQMLTKLGTPVVVGGGYPGTGAGTDEVQRVTMSGTVTGGTFTLTVVGIGTTAAIPWNATAAQVGAALVALPTMKAADVTASGGPLPGSFVTLTFGGQFNDENVAQVTANGASLTGTAPVVAATTITDGGATAPPADSEFIAASPALFGYRSQIFEGTSRPGDLMDRTNNNMYGIAERNYLIGYDACGVAFAPVTLGP